MRFKATPAAFLLAFLTLPAVAQSTIRSVGLVVSADPRITKLFQSNLRRELGKLDEVVFADPEAADWVVLVKAMPIKAGDGSEIGFSAAAVSYLERVQQMPAVNETAEPVPSRPGPAIGAAADAAAPPAPALPVVREGAFVNALRDQVLLVVGDDYIPEVCHEIALKFDAQLRPRGHAEAVSSASPRVSPPSAADLPEVDKPQPQLFPEFEKPQPEPAEAAPDHIIAPDPKKPAPKSPPSSAPREQ